MNIRRHKELVVQVLQEVLAEPNARTAAQHKLFILKASLLTKQRKTK